MKPPLLCPSTGITAKCELVEVRDGDTIVVSVLGPRIEWAIRLIDCWCPELHRGDEATRELGRRAKEYARQVLVDGPYANDLRVYVPFPEVADDMPVNLLSYLTFDRVPGYLYVGPAQTLNRLLVLAGLATSRKNGPLGE